jgi:hypothetical protein
MQWLFDKHLEQFLFLRKVRDQYVQNWEDMRKVLELSQKTDLFEQKALKLPKDEGYQIINWLKDNLGLKIDPEESMISKTLSKRIYNFVLRSISTEQADLSIEQRGNLAYTKWRNIIFEIVSQIPSLNKVIGKFPNKPPRAVLDILSKQLAPILEPLLGEVWKKQNPIVSGKPGLNLLSILQPDKHEGSSHVVFVFDQIIKTISQQMYKLMLETLQHKNFLSKMKEKYSQLDTNTDSGINKIDMLHGLVSRLTDILRK